MKLFCKALLLFITLTSSTILPAQTVTDSISPDELKMFEKVEVEAYYPGGDGAWRKFLEKNLKPETPVVNGSPLGKYTVIVQFIVDKEGNVSDLKALTKLGYGMEQEVMRIIKKSGKWAPAMQGGRVVKAYRKQPVVFFVAEDGVDISTDVPYTLFTNTENKVGIHLFKGNPDLVQVSITGGSITKTGAESYIIKANKPGRVLLTILEGKKSKQVAVVSFEVLDRDSKQ